MKSVLDQLEIFLFCRYCKKRVMALIISLCAILSLLLIWGQIGDGAKFGGINWQIERIFRAQQKKFDSVGPKSDRGLSADGSQFKLDGRPFRILSGGMHYFRVPRQYWYNRLRYLKACGLNTVETYVAWNLHEPEEGIFKYSGDLNLVEFIKLAKEFGLYVIIRPGPYICAEWDFGGLPAWLLGDPDMAVRTTYKGFMVAARRYLNDLLSRLWHLQYSKGGPIIAFQIENEYLSYDNDVNYMRQIKAIYDRSGISELLFTSDGSSQMDKMGKDPLPGVLATVNFQSNADEELNILANFQPNKPLMVTEFWAGWFDHWSETHNTFPLTSYVENLEAILKRNASVNFYMFHGGTNFGFMNGANAEYTKDSPYYSYLPTVTSYDYDAPLSESGSITPKYKAAQLLIEQYVPQAATFTVHRHEHRVPIGKVQSRRYLTLTDVMDEILEPIGTIFQPTYVEYLCQKMRKRYCSAPYYGFVAYRKKLDGSYEGTVNFNGIVADRMQIILDGQTIHTIYTGKIGKLISIDIQIKKFNKDLILLVENMGRVNFDQLNNQRKGLEGSIQMTKSHEYFSNWTVYDLSLNQRIMSKISESTNLWRHLPMPSMALNQPTFYSFNVKLPPTTKADYFLNFKGWNKGVAFVNDINLGRFWHVGPQKTLYVPFPFLKRQNNEFIMFELEPSANPKSISLDDSPKLDENR